jgi:MFS family permease
MTHLPNERIRLALLVWGVFVSQVFLYPGLEDVVAALGAPAGIAAGMWFLVAEFAGFVLFAGAWGALSDATGRRRRWIVVGAFGGAGAYLLVSQLPVLGVGFAGVLAVRFLGGALTIGALSLSITMLMDLTGGHGRNMGAAGIAIGLGAAVGSLVGGQLATLDPLAPLYGGAAVLVAVAVLATTLPKRVAASDRASVGAVLARVPERPPRWHAFALDPPSASPTPSASSTASLRAFSPSWASSTSGTRSGSTPPARG